jgi:hypothetical protein
MAIPSPIDIKSDLVTFTVKVNGFPINETYPVRSVYINHEKDKFSVAEIVILDGSPNEADFPISNSEDLIPGNEIEILAGYDTETNSIFKGIISSQSININDKIGSALIIKCKSAEPLSIGKPDYTAEPVLRVAYGESMINFEAEWETGVKGSVTYQGNANAFPGRVIELAGVGYRFNGKVHVSAISHNIADGNYITHTTFGSLDVVYPIIIDDIDRSITTLSRLKVSFDDDKKVITIETPGANKITLSDDAKSIEIIDQNLNKVTMDPSGMGLDSQKDITIKSRGNIILDAAGKIDIKANMDATTSAMNITHTANMAFTAKGSTSAEISASGQTTVKGSIVMIN